MIGYLVLNIGLPVLQDVDGGWQKFTIGFFQSLGVRASGLTILPIANLAPATLCVSARGWSSMARGHWLT